MDFLKLEKLKYDQKTWFAVPFVTFWGQSRLGDVKNEKSGNRFCRDSNSDRRYESPEC